MIIFKNKKSATKEKERKEKLFNKDYYILKTDNLYMVLSENLLNKNGYYQAKENSNKNIGKPWK